MVAWTRLTRNQKLATITNTASEKGNVRKSGRGRCVGNPGARRVFFASQSREKDYYALRQNMVVGESLAYPELLDRLRQMQARLRQISW